MQVHNMKQRSADPHNFAMIPKADIPRASFALTHNVKQAFQFSDITPIGVFEVLPGDLWKVHVNMVARTPALIVPIMDNWRIDTFHFFIPNRILWDNWVKLMGEQDNPGDSTSYTVPTLLSAVNGWPVGSLGDYMGVPGVGQITAGNRIITSALPFRAYNLIYNTWFRDENLQNSVPFTKNDGPDNSNNYVLKKRGKRHDYFTSALPFVQKGAAVSIPLGSTATVIPNPAINPPIPRFRSAAGDTAQHNLTFTTASTATGWNAVGGTTGAAQWENSTPGAASNTALVADLSTATSATINQLRQSFQIQKLLERDARGGSRYTEIVRSHFGVISPDARLQRPEYLGGGSVQIINNAIPQTSATGASGSTTPAGTLVAVGHAQGTNGFTYAATEHGYILSLAAGRADLTYQQGLSKMWRRSTRYDFYFPVFAALGEQEVKNYEIYAIGGPTGGNGAGEQDMGTFGYQERWAEYRYMPNRVAGIFRSTAAQTLDYWHSAQRFSDAPALNDTFITDRADVVTQRNFALGANSAGQQILADILFSGTMTRCMPTFSVPGLIDHF